ncbi:hypothetical protein [Streptomyces albidochromogenes]|uniref:DUF4260 family protein n=1 Tax=Streptomyces albidochromogenes TaxID=329524 RepID=A0ABW6FVS7_9ACTN
MTIGSTHDERDNGRGTAPASGIRRASRPFRSPVGLLAAVGHRWPTLLALALAVVTFADGLPALEFLAALLVVMPLCYLLFGALRGQLRPPRVLVLQIAGLLGFAAVALTALAVDETLGLHVLAAGWLAHAVWDFAHHRTGRVVPRAWAEWCCVVDACGALALALSA